MIFEVMQCWFFSSASYSYSIGFKWKIFSCTYVHIYAPKECYATFKNFPISTFLYHRIKKKKLKKKKLLFITAFLVACFSS